RHFRLSDKAKLVVGRDEKENDLIESLRRPDDCILEVLEFGSPIGLLRGEADETVMMTAASIVARYCDGKNQPLLRVSYVSRIGDGFLETAPAGEAEVEAWRV
ncbi:MAG: hypothetical protein JSU85_13140, partial [Candidatus Zixiibacteriota bacterium]